MIKGLASDERGSSQRSKAAGCAYPAVCPACIAPGSPALNPLPCLSLPAQRIGQVLALARAALPAAAAAQAAFLFTTPPRTPLKDLSLSLYAAKLVPAAKMYVGWDAAKAGPPAAGAGEPQLRPEALALVGPPPQRADGIHRHQQQQQAGPAGGAAAARQGGAAGASQPQKGVPKWMKLGK